jgi:hypothetical protein
MPVPLLCRSLLATGSSCPLLHRSRSWRLYCNSSGPGLFSWARCVPVCTGPVRLTPWHSRRPACRSMLTRVTVELGMSSKRERGPRPKPWARLKLLGCSSQYHLPQWWAFLRLSSSHRASELLSKDCSTDPLVQLRTASQGPRVRVRGAGAAGCAHHRAAPSACCAVGPAAHASGRSAWQGRSGGHGPPAFCPSARGQPNTGT